MLSGDRRAPRSVAGAEDGWFVAALCRVNPHWLRGLWGRQL